MMKSVQERFQSSKMQVILQSTIPLEFPTVDAVPSHIVFFDLYQFAVLFVSLVILILFLFKSYQKPAAKHRKIPQCVEYTTPAKKVKKVKNKLPEKEVIVNELKEVRPRLSRKAKKRLKATSGKMKAPLPTALLELEEPYTDDIMKVIEDVGKQDVFVKSKEKKASVKKIKMSKDVQAAMPSLPVAPAPVLPGKAEHHDAKGKAAVKTSHTQNFQKKSRGPKRRPFTLNDYMLRSNMQLDAYVQTYRV